MFSFLLSNNTIFIKPWDQPQFGLVLYDVFMIVVYDVVAVVHVVVVVAVSFVVVVGVDVVPRLLLQFHSSSLSCSPPLF